MALCMDGCNAIQGWLQHCAWVAAALWVGGCRTHCGWVAVAMCMGSRVAPSPCGRIPSDVHRWLWSFAQTLPMLATELPYRMRYEHILYISAAAILYDCQHITLLPSLRCHHTAAMTLPPHCQPRGHCSLQSAVLSNTVGEELADACALLQRITKAVPASLNCPEIISSSELE
eukprot:359527-Chlamydomonas_euryale.AAC.3